MREQFKHRSHKLERLDTGDYTRAEFELWQKEMRVIHRLFGEWRALRNSLLRDVSAMKIDSPSVLDVGAGTGILLSQLRSRLGLDANLVGLEIDSASSAAVQGKGFRAVQADATQLPFRDSSFDFAYCTLMLHHLTDEDSIRLLREMRRVSRRRFFVIDLNRDWKSYFIYRTLGRMFLQRLTLEDGSLSIMRSFTPEELLSLADAAGVEATVTRSKFNRLVLASA